MWMHYASQSWTKAHDIPTSIERLGSELDALAFDSIHAANYDSYVCFDKSSVELVLKNAEKYSDGSKLCRKFSDGSMTIEEFCDKLKRMGLEHFLDRLRDHLPFHLIKKYDLMVLDYEQEEEEEVESETPSFEEKKKQKDNVH